MRDRFPEVITICITLVIVAVMGLAYSHCENQFERREACMKDPSRSAADCRMLYPDDWDKR